MFIISIASSQSSFKLFPIGILSALTIPLVLGITFATFESIATTNFVTDRNLFVDSFPNCVNAVSVIESFKYAVATDHDVIKVVLDLEALDIRLTDDDVWIATVPWAFGFDVSKSLGDGKPTRENSERSLDI